MDVKQTFIDALHLEQQGQPAQALQLYSTIIETDSSCRAAIVNAGVLYYRIKKYDEALEMFTRARTLKEDYSIHFNIGSVFFKIGHYKKAVMALDQCKKLNPHFYNAALVKGIAFSKLNNCKAALHCFKEVLEAQPENKAALQAIILLLYDEKKYSDALVYLRRYEKYYTSFKSSDIALHIVLECAKNQSPELIQLSLQKKEFKAFDEFIAAVPPTIFSDSKGDIKEKIQLLEEQIMAVPKAASLLSLSLCHLFTGDSHKALCCLAQALSTQQTLAASVRREI